MKIIVPLAGKDPKYEKLGVYKPLISVGGQPLIKYVLTHNGFPLEKLHFIILNEHEKKYNVRQQLEDHFGKDIHVYIIDKVTEGSPSTILEIEEVINDDEDILIELGDVLRDVSNLKKDIQTNNTYAGILPIDKEFTTEMWGYVRLEKNIVTYLHEKSLERMKGGATMGLYYFTKGKEFLFYTKQMIQKKIVIPPYNLYYVGVVYNKYIADGLSIAKSDAKIKYVLGSPDQIDAYLEKVKYNK